MSNKKEFFINSFGFKMIFVEAAPFFAWTPSFIDWWETHGKHGTWSGTHGRPPITYPSEVKAD